MGVLASIDINIPKDEQSIAKKAAQIVTPLKLLKMHIADKDGKITKADINKEPTRFIAKTMIIAITIANIRL